MTCAGGSGLVGSAALALGGLVASAAFAVSPSAARSAAVGALLTIAMISSGSTASSTPSGSLTSPAVTCEPASRPSIETSRCSGSCVASATIDSVCCSWLTRVSRAASPIEHDRDVDRDLLAARGRSAGRRGRRCRAPGHAGSPSAAPGRVVPSLISMLKTCVMPPWRMTAANSRAGMRDVLGGFAVTVEHGGHVAGATGATGTTLAELGARFGADAYLGHGNTPSVESAEVGICYVGGAGRGRGAHGPRPGAPRR